MFAPDESPANVHASARSPALAARSAHTNVNVTADANADANVNANEDENEDEDATPAVAARHRAVFHQTAAPSGTAVVPRALAAPASSSWSSPPASAWVPSPHSSFAGEHYYQDDEEDRIEEGEKEEEGKDHAFDSSITAAEATLADARVLLNAAQSSTATATAAPSAEDERNTQVSGASMNWLAMLWEQTCGADTTAAVPASAEECYADVWTFVQDLQREREEVSVSWVSAMSL
jgi:hypothetical protein